MYQYKIWFSLGDSEQFGTYEEMVKGAEAEICGDVDCVNSDLVEIVDRNEGRFNRYNEVTVRSDAGQYVVGYFWWEV